MSKQEFSIEAPRMQKQQLVVQVAGKVQGVGFRYFVRTAALRLGITGWVRNSKDGSLCVVAEGSSYRLNQLLQALKHGPSLSAVHDVKCEWQAPTGHFSEFSIRA